MEGAEAGPKRRPPFPGVRVGATVATLLVDGAQAFPAMLRAIAAARVAILVETYILRDDGTGWRFGRALAERARAGVEVSVLYDAWGSSVGEDFLDFLRSAGVRILPYHPIRIRGTAGHLLERLRRRNHRKVLVVDGKVAFTGGLNLADDYAAPEDGGQGWRDTHVRLEGPVAKELIHPFLRLWRRAGGAPVTEGRWSAEVRRPDPRVRLVGSQGRRGRRETRQAYLEAIDAATTRIWLTAAYFLPPVRVLRALLEAARRGVAVDVIVAGTTDVRPVLLAARALYGPLLRAGVRIHEWHGRVLHAKTAVIDGRWATVGSSNLDHLSMLVNLEVNAVIVDRRFAAALEDLFLEDLRSTREVTHAMWRRRPLSERFLSWFVYLFRGWL